MFNATTKKAEKQRLKENRVLFDGKKGYTTRYTASEIGNLFRVQQKENPLDARFSQHLGDSSSGGERGI